MTSIESPRSSAARRESEGLIAFAEQRAHEEGHDERVLVDDDGAERVVELDALGDQGTALFRLASDEDAASTASAPLIETGIAGLAGQRKRLSCFVDGHGSGVSAIDRNEARAPRETRA